MFTERENWREADSYLRKQEKSLRYIRSLVREHIVRTQEMKARIAIIKEAFNRNKRLLYNKSIISRL